MDKMLAAVTFATLNTDTPPPSATLWVFLTFGEE